MKGLRPHLELRRGRYVQPSPAHTRPGHRGGDNASAIISIRVMEISPTPRLNLDVSISSLCSQDYFWPSAYGVDQTQAETSTKSLCHE